MIPNVVPTMEMSGSFEFAGRIRRLVLVSAIALGSIWFVAINKLDLPVWVESLLLAGWVLMPTLLAISLRRPAARYLIAVPASLVSAALVAILVLELPATMAATIGWLLITTGILLGGSLGLWFWYRLLPVPGGLDYPFSPGRWVLVGIHVGLIVIGLMFVIAG